MHLPQRICLRAYICESINFNQSSKGNNFSSENKTGEVVIDWASHISDSSYHIWHIDILLLLFKLSSHPSTPIMKFQERHILPGFRMKIIERIH